MFSIRGLRLYFPALEPWVAQSALLPAVRPSLSMCECGAMGSATHHAACPVLCHSESGPLCLSVCKCRATGSASGQTACPICLSLRQSRSRQGNSSPLRTSCPSPPLLPVWMNVYFLSPWCWTSLPFDFLSVLVVQGGAVCLPTPPSWFSDQKSVFKKYGGLIPLSKSTTICHTVLYTIQLLISFKICVLSE